MALKNLPAGTSSCPQWSSCSHLWWRCFRPASLAQSGKDERLRAVYAAESTISRVSSQLNRYLAESDFIKKYIESGRVLREAEFAAISSNMQDGSNVIKTHELAKDGVISQVYPIAGNEAAIGLDVLHNPARKRKQTLPRTAGCTPSLVPSSWCRAARARCCLTPSIPIVKGERSFWGFSILVLQWDNFIDEVELDKMEDAGYQYQIWKKTPIPAKRSSLRRAKRISPAMRWKLRAASPTIHGILKSSRKPGGSRTSSSRWASPSPPSLA